MPAGSPRPRPVRADSSIVGTGEDLLYEVRWLFFKLGTIRVRTFPPVFDSGRARYTAAAFVDSYDHLPFVDLHVIDSTVMDERFWSRGYRFLEKKDEGWFSERSHYDLPAGRIIIEKGMLPSDTSVPPRPPVYDTVRVVDQAIQDGLSILFFARANLRLNADTTVPTIVYGKNGRTVFRFRPRREEESISALEDRKIKVLRLEGRADFDGIFGMTGEFRGWFSDDAAAVPIRAEVQILLGSISLELIQWNRGGWMPPSVPD